MANKRRTYGWGSRTHDFMTSLPSQGCMILPRLQVFVDLQKVRKLAGPPAKHPIRTICATCSVEALDFAWGYMGLCCKGLQKDLYKAPNEHGTPHKPPSRPTSSWVVDKGMDPSSRPCLLPSHPVRAPVTHSHIPLSHYALKKKRP